MPFRVHVFYNGVMRNAAITMETDYVWGGSDGCSLVFMSCLPWYAFTNKYVVFLKLFLCLFCHSILPNVLARCWHCNSLDLTAGICFGCKSSGAFAYFPLCHPPHTAQPIASLRGTARRIFSSVVSSFLILTCTVCGYSYLPKEMHDHVMSIINPLLLGHCAWW